MASTYDFTLTGDPAVAQQAVLDALAGAGHRVSPLQDGTLAVERGSGKATFWLGAMAGKNLHPRCSLQFFPVEGGTVARFTRAGSLGASRAARSVTPRRATSSTRPPARSTPEPAGRGSS